EPETVYRPEQIGAGAPTDTLATAAATVKAAGPRNLQIVDDQRLLFSVGPKVLGITEPGEAFTLPVESRSDVIALIPDDARLHVVHEDGAVCSLDRQTLQVASSQRRS